MALFVQFPADNKLRFKQHSAFDIIDSPAAFLYLAAVFLKITKQPFGPCLAHKRNRYIIRLNSVHRFPIRFIQGRVCLRLIEAVDIQMILRQFVLKYVMPPEYMSYFIFYPGRFIFSDDQQVNFQWFCV